MPTGKLKWFDLSKGFGFIVPDGGGPDVYLAAKTVEASRLPTLSPGMALSFEVTETRGRKAAITLSLLTPTSKADPVEAFEEEWGLRPS